MEGKGLVAWDWAGAHWTVRGWEAEAWEAGGWEAEAWEVGGWEAEVWEAGGWAETAVDRAHAVVAGAGGEGGAKGGEGAAPLGLEQVVVGEGWEGVGMVVAVQFVM